VLLTGIHLMRSGEIEANLLTLNEEFRLAFLHELIAQKLGGPEKAIISGADISFHEVEVNRLRQELEAAYATSKLPELPSEETRAQLSRLLVRFAHESASPERQMKITIPELALVVLIGPSGSGKSSFAKAHFKATEVLSSDACRGLVSDDENDQAATKDAFEVLHFIGAKRLAAAKLTVVDATNVQEEARKPLVALAREYHCLPVAILFDLPEKLCRERNRDRPDRTFGPHVIRQQIQQLHRSLRKLERDGFRQVFVLRSPEEVDAVTIERQPLWNNRRAEHGPFDIIGDIHGCYDELALLLTNLGYSEQVSGAWAHAENRKLIFVGDLVDRGPKIPEVVRLVLESVKAGAAFCVPGNHDIKFMRSVRGKKVQLKHGLAESLQQFETYNEHHPGFNLVAADFVDSLVSHYVFDDGRLVVAHAGMKESMQGRASGKVREFALYGETTGETDEFRVTRSL
jgi:protein phosphatase